MTFKLRPWRENDIDRLVKIANNNKIAANLTNKFPHPYTRASGKAFIAHANSNTPQNINAIEIDGLVAGAVGVFPLEDIFCKNAEMGYWLAEEFWGKGIMTQAVAKMVEYGFANFDINRIFARPFGSNKSSQRVLEKAGFKLEGSYEKTIYKNEIYEDELIYAVRR